MSNKDLQVVTPKAETIDDVMDFIWQSTNLLQTADGQTVYRMLKKLAQMEVDTQSISDLVLALEKIHACGSIKKAEIIASEYIEKYKGAQS